VSHADPMRLARDERADLADLLAGLTAEQWTGPTLCTHWRVRDVVAHVVSYDDLGPLGLAGRFARGWFVPDRVNEVGVRRYAALGTDELLAELENHLRPAGLTAAFGGRIGLCDSLIHHQDIRRALGTPREVPAERLAEVLPFARTAPPIKASRRVRGLRLVATDLDWGSGTGPAVEGPAEALLMAMAGRPHALDDLGGPGKATLAGRLTPAAGPRRARSGP
jgi:uncharacterized protein (TIGR03083 family)